MENPFDRYLFSIRLFASVLIFVGVSALFDLVLGIFNDACMLNLNVVALPVGIGLLNRSKEALPWAVFFSWVGIIIAPIAIVILFDSDPGALLNRAGVPTVVTLSSDLTALLFTAIFPYSLWQRHVLTRPVVRQAFEEKDCAPPAHAWWPVVVTLAFFTLAIAYGAEYIHKETVRSVYSCRVTIEAVDAETGEPLQFFVSGPHSEPTIGSGDIFPRSVTSASMADSPRLHLSVIAIRPVTFTVGADGYESQEVTINEGRDEELIRVALRGSAPIDPNSTGGDIILSRE